MAVQLLAGTNDRTSELAASRKKRHVSRAAAACALCHNRRMDLADSLSNQLLIAMPGMADPNFATTVTLICEHNSEGALGIVVNRPMDLKFSHLLKHLDVAEPDDAAGDLPVLNGGPVAPERGFVLHSPGETYESSMTVSHDVQLTLSRDVIDAVATGNGPDRSLLALGYAGWDAGQLEREMLENTWLTVPASAEIIFDVPFENRWTVAANSIGIDLGKLSPHAGHA